VWEEQNAYVGWKIGKQGGFDRVYDVILKGAQRNEANDCYKPPRFENIPKTSLHEKNPPKAAALKSYRPKQTVHQKNLEVFSENHVYVPKLDINYQL
jgi:hypothetical protein